MDEEMPESDEQQPEETALDVVKLFAETSEPAAEVRSAGDIARKKLRLRAQKNPAQRAPKSYQPRIYNEEQKMRRRETERLRSKRRRFLEKIATMTQDELDEQRAELEHFCIEYGVRERMRPNNPNITLVDTVLPVVANASHNWADEERGDNGNAEDDGIQAGISAVFEKTDSDWTLESGGSRSHHPYAFNNTSMERTRFIQKYICTLCSQESADRDELKSHISLVHVSLAPYRCELCPVLPFATERSVFEHCLRLHPPTKGEIDYVYVSFLLKADKKSSQVRKRIDPDAETKRAELRRLLQQSLVIERASTPQVDEAVQSHNGAEMFERKLNKPIVQVGDGFVSFPAIKVELEAASPSPSPSTEAKLPEKKEKGRPRKNPVVDGKLKLFGLWRCGLVDCVYETCKRKNLQDHYRRSHYPEWQESVAARAEYHPEIYDNTCQTCGIGFIWPASYERHIATCKQIKQEP